MMIDEEDFGTSSQCNVLLVKATWNETMVQDSREQLVEVFQCNTIFVYLFHGMNIIVWLTILCKFVKFAFSQIAAKNDNKY